MKFTNPTKAYQADVLSREHAFYVSKARSWLPIFHKSPDCKRVADKAVLHLFLECLSWIHAADGADLHWFWEKLLEESGFESDQQRFARVWEEICERSTNPLYNPSLKSQNAGDGRENENLNGIWDPDLWDGTPRIETMSPQEEEEYKKKHPILYPAEQRQPAAQRGKVT